MKKSTANKTVIERLWKRQTSKTMRKCNTSKDNKRKIKI